MTNAINKILIVGGGTSGWLSAAYLAKRLACNKPGSVQITLIESSDIPTLGVGEGTVPTLRRTLAAIGVNEADFMRECTATFKQGIFFRNWAHAPSNKQEENEYFHPFEHPKNTELLPYWLQGHAGDQNYSAAVSPQEHVCRAGLGPKLANDPGYNGRLNYAYHLDAGLFAEFLKKHCKSMGVEHVIGTVQSVQQKENGDITSITCEDGSTLSADLFIDCSGFNARLLEGCYAVPFINKNDELFVNKALAVQVPYQPNETIPPYTIATAHEAGWTWDIALSSRRGVGYVYSDRYTTDEQAEQVLKKYVGPAFETLSPRKLNLHVGYREKHWVNNCVAIGLAGGFLEPLESTGIMLVEVGVQMLANYFQRNGNFAAARRSYNELMRHRYEYTLDFIKLHYFLAGRDDNDFWRDNRAEKTVSDRLLDKLAMWRSRPICGYDLVTDYDVFTLGSYQYILYGLGFKTELQLDYPHGEFARKEFANITAASKQACANLPSHQALLSSIYAITRSKTE